jgi:hypothetical protein
MWLRMADGFPANTKGALIFAGAVIAFAALIGGSMGSQFVPGSAGDDLDVQAAAEEGTPAESAEPESEAEPSGFAEEDSVFGEFQGFASDEELIDDTAGFNAGPVDDEPFTVIETVDEGSDSAAAETRPSKDRPRQTAQRAPRPRRNARPEDLSVKDVKDMLRQPPRVGNGGE